MILVGCGIGDTDVQAFSDHLLFHRYPDYRSSGTGHFRKVGHLLIEYLLIQILGAYVFHVPGDP